MSLSFFNIFPFPPKLPNSRKSVAHQILRLPNCGVKEMHTWAHRLAFPETGVLSISLSPVRKGSFKVSRPMLTWSQSCCRLAWQSCALVMWETRELREHWVLVAVLPLWLTLPTGTSIEQRVPKRSFERSPCFPLPPPCQI